MNATHDFGLIGLAVMGQNLALNVRSRGFAVSVYNRTASVTQAFVAAHAQPGLAQPGLFGAGTLAELVHSLKRPRRIMLMVKAGAAVDAVIDELLPLLDAGDIVVDGGNSLYTDTERRDAALAAKGLHFVGAGVSGGEEGARKGPSIMPGGAAAAWRELQPVFERIAAQVEGRPCVMHIGPGGAGHYVKMVHNGIEYGDMQLICEAYALLQAAGLGAAQIADVFERWNAGELQSYLVQITAVVLRQRDPETGRPLVELIQDSAGQKGTGRWTLVSAAEQGVAVGTINAAVEARVLSSLKSLRVAASQQLQGPPGALAELPAAEREALVAKIADALYAAKVVSYAQGMDLLRAMGQARGWALDLGGIAAIWRGGCIIRAAFLGRITEAYAADPGLQNLMLAPFFSAALNRAQGAWRSVVALAVQQGIAVPALSAALASYDGLRTARGPANLLQAQRDLFGAHGYERIDRPAAESFHTDWPDIAD